MRRAGETSCGSIRVPGGPLGALLRPAPGGCLRVERMPLVTFIEGWYDEEGDGPARFRWMGREAKCRICVAGTGRNLCLRVTAGHAFSGERSRLAVSCDGRPVGEREVAWYPRRHVFPIWQPDQGGIVSITLALDRTFAVEGDERTFGAVVHAIDLLDLDGLDEVADGEGWYDWQHDEYFASRWMGLESEIFVPSMVWRRGRFASLPLRGRVEDGTQTLTVLHDDQPVVELTVLSDWHVYDFALPPPHHEADGNSSPLRLVFRANRLVPAELHPGDPRDLAVRVGALEVHDDARRHERVRQFHASFPELTEAIRLDRSDHASAPTTEADESATFAADNREINKREFERGRTVLASFPLNLGIDLYGKCNIKPPCVYCQWDHAKAHEGDALEAVVDDRTLQDYGPFFRAATSFINCSFGEPLLHPRLEEVVEFFARHGKALEMATNAQTLTPANIRALAGKTVHLYVSLDAASAETYARLRNDRWHDIVAGLTFLRDARLAANGLPRVFLVFMPMRANLHDLEAFFRLGRMVNADSIVLRPLNWLGHAGIKTERGGYRFEYTRELLTRAEVAEVVERSRSLARQYSLQLESQFDFGVDRSPGQVIRKELEQ